jgi:hypothetical protein
MLRLNKIKNLNFEHGSPTPKKMWRCLSVFSVEHSRFVYRRQIPDASKTELLLVDQQLLYNDLNFFRKCLEGDAEIDAMARITATGRVMRNSGGQHRLNPPKVRTDLGHGSSSYRVATQWSELSSALESICDKSCNL